MTDERVSKLIFDSWKAGLRNKDRSHKNLFNNFEELFQSLRVSSVGFDTAESLIRDAVKAHMFDKRVAKSTYNRVKPFGKSLSEFEEDWKELIRDQAKAAFDSQYPLEEKLLKEGVVINNTLIPEPKPIKESNPHLDRMKQMAANLKK